MLARDLVDGYQAAREKVALFDLSARTKVELRGPDRVAFLQNFCTNDVAGLKPGSGCEAFITTGQARIIAHVVVFASDTSLWLDADAELADKIIAHLDRYLITEKVELIDRTREWGQFRLVGPLAHSTLANAHPQLAALSDLQTINAIFAKTECQVRRHDNLVGPGYDILCNAHQTTSLQDLFVQLGAIPVEAAVYEILRVEAGWPEYGKDIDETNLPQEVGRDERTISFTKGCYLGQETVARIKAYGHVNRRLVGLQWASTEMPPHGSRLRVSGRETGKLTSCAVSPRLGSAIALAMVRREHAAPGTEMEFEGLPLKAAVHSLPFIASATPMS